MFTNFSTTYTAAFLPCPTSRHTLTNQQHSLLYSLLLALFPPPSFCYIGRRRTSANHTQHPFWLALLKRWRNLCSHCRPGRPPERKRREGKEAWGDLSIFFIRLSSAPSFLLPVSLSRSLPILKRVTFLAGDVRKLFL